MGVCGGGGCGCVGTHAGMNEHHTVAQEHTQPVPSDW